MTLKVWNELHHRSFKILRSVLPVSVFTFQGWTRTFICRQFWMVSSAQRNGWHPRLGKLAENRGVQLSKQLQGPMED